MYNYENSAFAKYGNRTLRVANLMDTQLFLRRQTNASNLKGHKIYAKVSALVEHHDIDPGIYIESAQTSDYWPPVANNVNYWYRSYQYPVVQYKWVDVSAYYDNVPYNYLNIMLAQANITGTNEAVFHFDGLVVIDLTATFGSGNEPDKDWCDRHIDYFDGITTIYK